MEKDAVYILDSYGLIYRSYFAMVNHPITNTQGQNISAVVIFFKNLLALIKKYKPKYLVAAFDSKTPTFRHEMYAEYKATRAKTPEDLHVQVDWIEEILNALNIPVIRVNGVEADDIIATLAKRCKSENHFCKILSADKDLLQLVDEKCTQLQPDKFNGGWEEKGIEEVKEKWGIGPEKILDFLSLIGDTADNVPGVQGVGEKTALKLLNEYKTLDGIYEHADEIKGALGEKIRKDKENAYFSKKLITLKDDVEINNTFEDFDTSRMNYSEGAKTLAKYGAFQIAKAYGGDSSMMEKSLAAQEKTEGKETPAASLFNFEEAKDEQLNIRKNEGKYRPVQQYEELKKIIDEILSSSEKTFAFDTETDSLDSLTANLVGFSICTKSGEAVYVPVILPGGIFAASVVPKEKSIQELERLFLDPQITVIGHNIKFDLHVLYTNGMKKVQCKIFDTMIAAWLLNSGASGKSPYGLEYLGETKLGLKGIEFNDVVPKGKTFADVELEKAYRYGAEDADFTFQLYEYFKPKLQERKLNDIFYKMEMPLIPILTQMEENGIYLDKIKLKDYSIELKEKIASVEQSIYKEAGHEFNIASPKQLQTVLFEERGLPAGKKTKTGYSTDTNVLEELAENTSDPLPELILEYRSASKLLSTYVETLPELADKNGRIHTSFLQTGTATGRLSSRDPNLQNIPVRDEGGRKIRSAFVASPGCCLISADYAQIELCVMAHLSKDKNLRAAFVNGTDVHKSTAALINGISPDEVTPQMRRLAKTVNFGVIYGMSAFRLAKDLGISRTEAKNFIDKYFATYEGVQKFLEETVTFAKQNSFVQTISGRQRFVPDINNRNKLVQQGAERVAVNSPIQGSAADIVKAAMIKVNDELKKSGLKIKMLLQVHDELIFECAESDVEEAIKIIQNQMENCVHLEIPLRVSIEHGSCWGEFH